MSYAGPATRRHRSATPQNPAAARDAGFAAERSTNTLSHGAASAHRADGHETDWQNVAVFGVGLALGLSLGAGIALLAAPQSGEETRAALKGRARRIRRSTSRRGQDAWADLRDELRSATKTLRRRRAQRAARKALQRELEREGMAD
ncbi:MAG TPA: YtxH domain-containing protein [Gemmatimonadaceae bacterium]|nr:YtxH domain-containing protein [Gemmatimonadaceae bacterium]